LKVKTVVLIRPHLPGRKIYARLGADMEQTGEAIAAIEETVSIRRQLAETHPHTFMYERDVALALAELADVYAQAHRITDATAAGDEGVEILRTLSTSHRFLFPDYLNALSRNGSMKTAVEEWGSAATDLGAAVRGFHAATERDRSQFEPGLGVAMGRLRTLLEAVSRQPDGLRLLAEISTLFSNASDSRTPDPGTASVTRELALLQGDQAAAIAALESFKQLSSEFPGIFTPDVERCETRRPSSSERRVGCETCWGDDPAAVTERRGTHDFYATLVSSSHFMVSIRRCRTCAQLFASIFTEYIDWDNSEDAQYTVLVPIFRAEADDLITGRIDVFAIGALAGGRRHLHSDWPSGAEKRLYWSESPFTVDEGE
jgi:hypothetical protein